MSRISGIRAWLLCGVAPQMPYEIGGPLLSQVAWIFDPRLPRSVDRSDSVRSKGPSPLTARTLTESIVHRYQSGSAFAPSRSSTTRGDFAHIRAWTSQ